MSIEAMKRTTHLRAGPDRRVVRLWSTAGVVARLLEHAESWEVRSGAALRRPLESAILIVTRRGGAWQPCARGVARHRSGAMFCHDVHVIHAGGDAHDRRQCAGGQQSLPVFAAILGWLVLGVPLRAYTWVAIAAAVAGMAWISPRLGGVFVRYANRVRCLPSQPAFNVVTLRIGDVRRSRAGRFARRSLFRADFAAVAFPFEASAHEPRVARRARNVPAGSPLHYSWSSRAVTCLPPGRALDAARSRARAVVGLARRGRGVRPPRRWRAAVSFCSPSRGNEMIALYGPARFRRVRVAH